MAKGRSEDTVEIVDPGKVRFYVNATDPEWQTLLEWSRITNQKKRLREWLYEFIGKCEAVEHQRPLVAGDKIPLFNLVVEAYLVPQER